MFNTRSTNNENSKNDTNTFGPSFINEETMQRISVSYWNKVMVLEIADVAKDPNGFYKAKENSSLKAYISQSTASTLLSIGEEILEDIKSGKAVVPAGVPYGLQSDNFIEFSNGSNIGEPEGLYLVIYTDLKDDRTSSKYAAYRFNVRTIVKEYNHATGTAKTAHTKTQEFKDFLNVIKEYSKALTMAGAHAAKEGNKYEKMSTYRVLSIMAAQMGIDLSSPNFNNKKKQRTPLFENSMDSDDSKSLTLDESSFSTVTYDFEDVGLN